MRLMKSYVPLFLWCLASLAGCSVKEDRSECPCRLTIDMSDVHIDSQDSLELVITSDSSVIHSVRLDSLSCEDELMVEVPKVSLRLMAWCGGEGMISRDGLVIPPGSSCPRVYTHISDIDADAEVARETLDMRKNHCVVTVGLKYGAGEDMEITLCGDVCGYDEYGVPVQGDFCANVSMYEADSLYQVVIPRQTGGELQLNLKDDIGKVKTFPLSTYIDAIGYDWTSPDLEDLDITIDIVRTIISLSVSGWDEEFFFDVVI